VSFAADIELLCVYQAEFETILRETMAEWNASIKASIQRFDYFKNFNNEQVRANNSGNQLLT
jgi:hypothetical protein